MKKTTRPFFSFSKEKPHTDKKTLSSQDVVNFQEYRMMGQSLSTKTILLVHHDNTTLNQMRKACEGFQYKILTAKDPMDVSKVMEQLPIDIILLDIELPWIDGYELCLILKSFSHLKDLPIALLSEKNTKEERLKAFQFGCDDYISKPFDVLKIQETLSKFIS